MKEYSKEWQQLVAKRFPGLVETLSEGEKKRQYITLELIDSWARYVKDLETLNEGFVCALREYLPRREFEDIFANFDEVLAESRAMSIALLATQEAQNYFVEQLGQTLSREVSVCPFPFSPPPGANQYCVTHCSFQS